MKLSTAILPLTAFSVLASSPGAMGQNLRALNVFQAKGYPFDISPQEMGKFRSQQNIKGNAELDLQEEDSDGSFSVEGILVTKKNCKYVDAYVEEGATYSSSGQQSNGSAPKSGLCKVDTGTKSVIVARDKKDKVAYALAFDKLNGRASSVVPITDDGSVLVTIKDSDFDENALKSLDLPDPLEAGGGGGRRHTQEEGKEITMTTTTDETGQEDHYAVRSLQTACGDGTKRQIRVAIAYDKSFCDAMEGEDKAIDRINTIVLNANNHFDQQGLCKVLAISHLDSGCGNTDYFSSAVDKTDMCVGGTNDVLQEFIKKWKASNFLASVGRSSAHLFFGSADGGYRIPNASGGSSIGCAYKDALCSSSYGYGVNYMTFWGPGTSVLIQSNLFSHELGHSAGSDHDTGIMAPSLSGSNVEFSTSSKNQINSHTDSRSTSCVPEVIIQSGCSSNSECDDGNSCTNDVCSNGQCSNTVDTSNSCSDGVECTNDVCTISGNCESTFSYILCPECTSNSGCNDNNSCTNDICSNGQCSNPVDTGNSCSDGDDCTIDVCTSSGTCQSTFSSILCPECTINSDCDDNNSCTDNECSPEGECVYRPNTSNSCSDGNDCTVDSCTSSGTCQSTFSYTLCPDCTSDSQCNDNNSCTDNICSGGQCVYPPNTSNSCSDGDSCTADSCTSSGTCLSTTDYNLAGCVPTCPVAGDNCKWERCCPGLSCVKGRKGARYCA